MQKSLLIGAGSGLVGATLFASAATGTALAEILVYLSPLPLCLAGLGWGTLAVAAAALIGTAAVAAVLGAESAAMFALGIGIPAALLCRLALLARPAAHSADASASATTEWYPPGRILGWAALLAGAVTALMLLILGYDIDSYRDSIKQLLENGALKELDPDGTLFNPETISNVSSLIARALPAAFAVIWLSVMLFDLWMAGLIVEASGRSLRPWPRLDQLELPNSVFLAFVVALAGSFLPGIAGWIATGFAGALMFAYVLQGLAVLHAFTRGIAYRPLLLAAIYFAMALLGWVTIIVAIIGLGEPIFRLRERASMRGQPPTAK